VLLLMGSGAGCKRRAAPIGPPLEGAVRLDALYPAHPAWEDVRQLDALIAHARRVRAQALASRSRAGSAVSSAGSPASVSLPTVRMPAPLRATALPPDGRTPGIEGARELAALRVDQLDEALSDHNADVLAKVRQAEEKRVAADVAAERARLVDSPPTLPPTPENRAALAALRRLRFRQIALESQVRVLTLPAILEVERDLNQTLKEIAALEASLEVKAQDVDRLIEEAVGAFQTRRRAESAGVVATRAAELEAETDRVVSAYAGRVEARLATVSLPGGIAVAAPGAMPDLTLTSPADLARRAVPAAPGPVGSGRTASLAALEAARERLVQFVTKDVRTRVDRIAARRRWRVIYTTSSAKRTTGTDLTPDAATMLREEFARARTAARALER
jgi:hypothetical protein